jgi:pyruvate,orthophosphate dikinase
MAKKATGTKKVKYVYHFGNKTDGHGKMKELLGGKGANLAEMTRIGLPVPPGFTISTEVCTYYYDHKRTYPKVLQSQMEEGVKLMEKQLGKKFGDKNNPLLLSVRSGARESMPGMMDTILNLGLNDETVEALAVSSGNERFAWDSYRRFIQMYGDVVMGVQKLPSEDEEPFELVIEKVKKDRLKNAHAEDTALSAEDLKVLVEAFKKLVKQRTGKAFPNNPWDQLRGAVGAVFSS